MTNTVSILMVGVGGQGIVLAGDILATAAMYAGYDVKKSEVHGMAQRGGSVVSHVRFGKEVHSPVIPQGSADYIISFESMEFMRCINYAHSASTLILNKRKILPASVTSGMDIYPQKEIELYKKNFRHVTEFDAEALAAQAGNQKTAGTVMLGVLAKKLSISSELWRKAIEKCIPAKIISANLKAFDSGASL